MMKTCIKCFARQKIHSVNQCNNCLGSLCFSCTELCFKCQYPTCEKCRKYTDSDKWHCTTCSETECDQCKRTYSKLVECACGTNICIDSIDILRNDPCGVNKCIQCEKFLCTMCSRECSTCGEDICGECETFGINCDQCDTNMCQTCSMRCDQCDIGLCTHCMSDHNA